jgi:hypothetical protein
MALMLGGQTAIPVTLELLKAFLPMEVSPLMSMLPKAIDPTQPESVLFLM